MTERPKSPSSRAPIRRDGSPPRTTRSVDGDWYAHPRYYDIAFRADTKAEADFVEQAHRTYGRVRASGSLEVDRGASLELLEPGCGSGRLVVELAARGHRLTGFDLREEPLVYLRSRLRRRRLEADVFRAGLERFGTRRRFDAAYCFCNTFRHLSTETEAARHLELVRDHLRVGGIYLLGLHVFPPDTDLYDCERWSESYRGTKVTVTFRVLEAEPAQRRERIRVNLLARGPRGLFRVRSDFPLRTYDAKQLRRLLARVPGLELCAVHDFDYRIDQPRELDDQISDTVLVLRKRRK